MTDKPHIPDIAAATVAHSSDLRHRIAYAIAQADGDAPGMEPASCDYEMADAVIEALGLREERTETETVTNEQGATWFRQGGYRYVTEWSDNG